jgi:hypothetical protein
MVRLEQEVLALASSTHNVFVGQAGTSHEVKGLMPEEFRAVALEPMPRQSAQSTGATRRWASDMAAAMGEPWPLIGS